MPCENQETPPRISEFRDFSRSSLRQAAAKERKRKEKEKKEAPERPSWNILDYPIN